jgi:hypothetical protein
MINISPAAAEQQAIYELVRHVFLEELVALAQRLGRIVVLYRAESHEAAVARIGAEVLGSEHFGHPSFSREVDRALTRALELRPDLDRRALYAALVPLKQLASGYFVRSTDAPPFFEKDAGLRL